MSTLETTPHEMRLSGGAIAGDRTRADPDLFGGQHTS